MKYSGFQRNSGHYLDIQFPLRPCMQLWTMSNRQPMLCHEKERKGGREKKRERDSWQMLWLLAAYKTIFQLKHIVKEENNQMKQAIKHQIKLNVYPILFYWKFLFFFVQCIWIFLNICHVINSTSIYYCINRKKVGSGITGQ